MMKDLLKELKEEGLKSNFLLSEDIILEKMKRNHIDSSFYDAVVDNLREEGIFIDESIQEETLEVGDYPLSDSVKTYLSEIGKFSLLSLEQEQELFKRISDGDDSAKELMINSNLRLVVSIAKKYVHSGMGILDLIQEGNLGLITAVNKFNAELGYKFSTYASWWIRQAITRSIADKNREIRLPVYASEKLNKIKTFEKQYEKDTGCKPTKEEVCNALDISAENYVLLKSYDTGFISIYSKIGDDGTSELLEFLPDDVTLSCEESVILSSLSEELSSALKTVLTDKEERVLRMRFGLDDTGRHKTLEECGQVFGCTRERIRQIESKALKKLKLSKKSRCLKEYIPDSFI